MANTQSAQEAHVAGGLALGFVDLGVTMIENDKLRFEFAFSQAWGRFEYRGRFPRIARETGADPYYQLVDDFASRRRYLPVAAFFRPNYHSAWAVRIRREDDTMREAIEDLESDSGVPWQAWRKLATDFMESYANE